jgi:hypothetical protein
MVILIKKSKKKGFKLGKEKKPPNVKYKKLVKNGNYLNIK